MPTIPRRESELQRPRSRKSKDAAPVTHGVMRKVTIPAADKDWHPIAKRIYNSLKTSGQSDFYQNSDWAMAFSALDDLSRYKFEEDRSRRLNAARDAWEEEWLALSPEERKERTEAGDGKAYAPPWGGKGGSAMKLEAVMSTLATLMVTEGDRRKMRLELQPPTPEQESASVTAIASYREGLGLNGGK